LPWAASSGFFEQVEPQGRLIVPAGIVLDAELLVGQGRHPELRRDLLP
jgi:hypothetical protein